MMFGHVETVEDRIEHLNLLRQLQDRTHGFTAFIGWTFQSENTRLRAAPVGAQADSNNSPARATITGGIFNVACVT